MCVRSVLFIACVHVVLVLIVCVYCVCVFVCLCVCVCVSVCLCVCVSVTALMGTSPFKSKERCMCESLLPSFPPILPYRCQLDAAQWYLLEAVVGDSHPGAAI